MLIVDMDSSLLCVDEKGERVHTYPPTSEKFKHLIPIVKLLKKCIGTPPPLPGKQNYSKKILDPCMS